VIEKFHRMNYGMMLFLLGFLLGGAPVASATVSFQVTDARVQYHFGQDIHFQGSIQSNLAIQTAYLFFRPDGSDTRVSKVAVDNQGKIDYPYDAHAQPIRAFSRVYYWYGVDLQDGKEYNSPAFWFDYIDNRYPWQTLEDREFQVHWYDGDAQFGQAILSTAHQGLTRAQKIASIPPPGPIKIYVYASAADLQGALQTSGESSWIAGQALTGLDTALVSIQAGSGQDLELERQVPHEITHLMVYATTGQEYALLPVWLNEGLASLSEMRFNPDYTSALDAARDHDALLPLESLCGAFPPDPSGVFLAYAEAASFTRFLEQTYGDAGLRRLISGYANGLGCEEGFRSAFSASLAQVETRWRQETLRVDEVGRTAHNLAPYLVLFALILLIPIAIGLRSAWRARN
jgi:hypothetical protein